MKGERIVKVGHGLPLRSRGQMAPTVADWGMKNTCVVDMFTSCFCSLRIRHCCRPVCQSDTTSSPTCMQSCVLRTLLMPSSRSWIYCPLKWVLRRGWTMTWPRQSQHCLMNRQLTETHLPHRRIVFHQRWSECIMWLWIFQVLNKYWKTFRRPSNAPRIVSRRSSLRVWSATPLLLLQGFTHVVSVKSCFKLVFIMLLVF